LYTFVRDDPLNHRDPLGLDCDGGVTGVTAPDGSVTCEYTYYPKTVYETVVHAKNGDVNWITQTWLPDNLPWMAKPWDGTSDAQRDAQAAIDASIDKALIRHMRAAIEREDRCAAANATLAAAANSYARVSANIAAHNLRMQALQWEAVEVAAETAKSSSEAHNGNVLKSLPATVAGVAGVQKVFAHMRAGGIERALLEAEQQEAVEAMRSAADARDAACQ
jgi:hypothetical protein